MRFIRLISRILIGIVFLFSGFVKALDPLGSTYKFRDYFEAFNLGFLEPIALPLAIILSLLELVIGFALFTGLRMKFTAWATLLVMFFFTGLTLTIAITNPVSDCGCFGDALILTNWQTFSKNLILLALAILVFAQRKKYNPHYEILVEWLLIISFTLTGLFLSIYCYQNLPVLDFRPYSIGTNIPEGMRIPPDAEPDQYETVLIYEKEGIQKEFAPDSIPWQDTTWKWVETTSVLIKKGYEPPIHDFIVTDTDGFDYTETLLNNPGYTFLLVTHNMNKANKAAFVKANELALTAMNNVYDFVCVTASTNDEIASLQNEIPLNFPVYSADEITLKTIIRSNPGLLLIKEGTILNKWHYNNFPNTEEIDQEDLTAYSLTELRESKEKIMVYALVFFFLFAITFIGWTYKSLTPPKPNDEG